MKFSLLPFILVSFVHLVDAASTASSKKQEHCNGCRKPMEQILPLHKPGTGVFAVDPIFPQPGRFYKEAIVRVSGRLKRNANDFKVVLSNEPYENCDPKEGDGSIVHLMIDLANISDFEWASTTIKNKIPKIRYLVYDDGPEDEWSLDSHIEYGHRPLEPCLDFNITLEWAHRFQEDASRRQFLGMPWKIIFDGIGQTKQFRGTAVCLNSGGWFNPYSVDAFRELNEHVQYVSVCGDVEDYHVFVDNTNCEDMCFNFNYTEAVYPLCKGISLDELVSRDHLKYVNQTCDVPVMGPPGTGWENKTDPCDCTYFQGNCTVHGTRVKDADRAYMTWPEETTVEPSAEDKKHQKHTVKHHGTRKWHHASHKKKKTTQRATTKKGFDFWNQWR